MQYTHFKAKAKKIGGEWRPDGELFKATGPNTFEAQPVSLKIVFKTQEEANQHFDQTYLSKGLRPFSKQV